MYVLGWKTSDEWCEVSRCYKSFGAQNQYRGGGVKQPCTTSNSSTKKGDVTETPPE